MKRRGSPRGMNPAVVSVKNNASILCSTTSSRRACLEGKSRMHLWGERPYLLGDGEREEGEEGKDTKHD